MTSYPPAGTRNMATNVDNCRITLDQWFSTDGS